MNVYAVSYRRASYYSEVLTVRVGAKSVEKAIDVAKAHLRINGWRNPIVTAVEKDGELARVQR